jgi:hypothetical protein
MAATIGGVAQLLAAASPMMVQSKINVIISQISGWTIFDRKRRMDAQKRGDKGNGQGAVLAPGTMLLLPMMTMMPTITTTQHRAIVAGWEGGTMTMQIITMGMKTGGNARFGLAAASRRWTFGRFGTWN